MYAHTSKIVAFNWCKSQIDRLTKIVRVELGKGIEGEADAVLSRGETDVPEKGGDNGRVLAVRVETEQTVDLINGVL